jgi:hypothetical protein
VKQRWKTVLAAAAILLAAFAAGVLAGYHQDKWLDRLPGIRPAQIPAQPEETTPAEESGKPQETNSGETGGKPERNAGQRSPAAPPRMDVKTPPVDADRVERSIQEAIREIQRNLEEQRRISDEILRQLEQSVHHERFTGSLLHPNGAFLP